MKTCSARVHIKQRRPADLDTLGERRTLRLWEEQMMESQRATSGDRTVINNETFAHFESAEAGQVSVLCCKSPVESPSIDRPRRIIFMFHTFNVLSIATSLSGCISPIHSTPIQSNPILLYFHYYHHCCRLLWVLIQLQFPNNIYSTKWCPIIH